MPVSFDFSLSFTLIICMLLPLPLPCIRITLSTEPLHALTFRQKKKEQKSLNVNLMQSTQNTKVHQVSIAYFGNCKKFCSQNLRNYWTFYFLEALMFKKNRHDFSPFKATAWGVTTFKLQMNFRQECLINSLVNIMSCYGIY